MKIIETPEHIKSKAKKGNNSKYPFRDLKLTQSLVFDFDEKMYCRVKSAVYQFKKHNPEYILSITIDRFMNIFYVTRY